MSKGYRISAATGLDRGDREHQQDQLCLLTHPRVPGCLLGVVADGMGGRSGGRKASDQVMLSARQLFERYSPDSDKPADLLQQLVNEAHLVIKLTAAASEEEPHSTLAAFLLSPDGACDWIHSGDSRIYHAHRGKPVFRTKDHSLVQQMVDRGELTPEAAATHPSGNILLGCLGTERDPPSDTHHIAQLGVGDALLACSDGLWHYFSSEELARTVEMLSAREACEFLVQKARTRSKGAGDNLALLIVKFDALGSA